MASRQKFRTLVLARRGQTVQHVGQVSDFLSVAGAVNREVCRFTSTEVVYGVTGTDVTRLPEYGVSP
jgi:hypothetical protein